MPIPFIMPKFDMDQETARVVEWLKQEGDQVRLDENVLVVETDKVAIDVAAPASGTLAALNAKPGDVVPVTTVIGYILAPGETLGDLPVERVESAGTASEPEATASADGPVQIGGPATPVARRVARELGVDLADVPTKEARISKADVERYAALEGERIKVPATPAARRIASEMAIDLAQISGSGPRGRVQMADVMAEVDERKPGDFRPAERIELAGTRRIIAERMLASSQAAPHIALSVEVDVGQFENVRERFNAEQAAAKKPNVSFTALLTRIVAWALARHPYLNASLIQETIYLWQEVNVGIAMATADGLIVPVIRGADRLSVGEITSHLAELTQKARNGRLELADIRDGTFTISNLGMFGIDHFRAIINPPESAILAVGRVIRKPVVVDEKDTVEVRPMLSLTLSADHRLVDGVQAANFLSDIVKAIESPDILLL